MPQGPLGSGSGVSTRGKVSSEAYPVDPFVGLFCNSLCPFHYRTIPLDPQFGRNGVEQSSIRCPGKNPPQGGVFTIFPLQETNNLTRSGICLHSVRLADAGPVTLQSGARERRRR